MSARYVRETRQKQESLRFLQKRLSSLDTRGWRGSGVTYPSYDDKMFLTFEGT